MGYRSQVVIVVNRANAASFLRLALKNDFSKSDFRQDGEGNVALVIDCCKWYEEYPDVAAVMSFLSGIDDDSYRFLRVGEESGDVEDKGCLDAFGAGVQTIVYCGEGDQPTWPADIELEEACDVDEG